MMAKWWIMLFFFLFFSHCHFADVLLKAFQWVFRKHTSIWAEKEQFSVALLLWHLFLLSPTLCWHCADTHLCFFRHSLDGGKPLNIAVLTNSLALRIWVDAEKKVVISAGPTYTVLVCRILILLGLGLLGLEKKCTKDVCWLWVLVLSRFHQQGWWISNPERSVEYFNNTFQYKGFLWKHQYPGTVSWCVSRV